MCLGMASRPMQLMSILVLVGSIYGCGKDDGSSDDNASAEQVDQAAVGYSAFLNLLDFSSNLIVADQKQALRAAVWAAHQNMRRLQKESQINYCTNFKKDFCDAKSSSRAGLLTECETTCEDGETPTTACTLSENIVSSCTGEKDAKTSVTARRDTTIEVTSTCNESEGKYFLDSDIKFTALLSGDSFEGIVTLECTFVQRNGLPDGTVEKGGADNCADFNCTIDGKTISCDQFQPAVEKSPCTI